MSEKRGSMRIAIVASAIVALLGSGCATTRVPASAADDHAGHDTAPATARNTALQQTPAIPASGGAAAERLAKSPRHAEWVAIKVGATDSVMAWVVYPERRDKAPVVVAIHENTGLNTWTRGVA